MILEVDVQPLAPSRPRVVSGNGDKSSADTLATRPGVTSVSRMKAWSSPSHATFTNPTSCSPSRAQTQPRLCLLTCSHHWSTVESCAKPSACKALTSGSSNEPRHS